jgi:NO-binding membrane sensor protein with MHYT domain
MTPFWVLLAYLVACAGSFATLDMAERVAHAENLSSQRLWRWVGACLAGGIWAMHFIGMLAFQVPVDVHFQLPVTYCPVDRPAHLLAGDVHPQSPLPERLAMPESLGLDRHGHRDHALRGHGRMQSQAKVYYQPVLFGLSILIAIGASLAALLLASHLRNGTGMFHQLFKYSASLVIGAGIISMHFTGMAAFNLLLPGGTALPATRGTQPPAIGGDCRSHDAAHHWQLHQRGPGGQELQKGS